MKNSADLPKLAAPSSQGVIVRNAIKSYGVGSRRSTVLDGLDMNVKKGTIYGLLGASGCGKTTLLSCIVGRRSFDSGQVMVLGGPPGTPDSGIPGPRVGYMPQELALYGEFTIKETLQYFGRIYKLEADFVVSQLDFLSKLLDLPPDHRYVKTLSGGQQRRVSFAVALFHEPELLILDEPTVGVDPLLRRSIWDHLVQQSVDHGRTVIITTHYIEEARQADAIGMMRSGRLLAEESPENLLKNYGLPTLEEVFLKLCMRDGSYKVKDAVVNAPISKEKSYTTSQNHLGGHENMAFNYSISQFDVSQVGVERQENIKSHPGSLAHYNVPTSKSTLPIDGNGIVCLNFNRCGDGSLPTYSNKRADLQQITNSSIQNPSKNGLRSAASFEMKGRHNLPLGGSITKRGTVYTINQSSSKSSENIIQDNEVISRRSRTFKMTMPSMHRSAALIHKNFMQTFRNIGMFLFVFLLPALQATIFCLAIGRDPTLLKMAIVNDELNPSEGRICNYTTDCSYFMFSCRYLRFVNNDTIIQVPYPNLSSAIEATRNGEVWGVVHFGQNFTDEIIIRQSDGSASSNETVIGSRIGVTMDFSNQQISVVLQRRLNEAFEDFTNDILRACDYEPTAGNIPVSFLDPVYGKKDSTYTEFMAPGMILTIVYFIAVALTAGVFISERKEGLLDRSLVAGVQMTEVLLAHLVNQFTILLGQTALVFLCMLAVFNIPCEGNLALAVFITLLQGLCGMSFGFLVSSICDSEISAIHLSLGSFYPTLLLSGIIWPIEGMTSTWMRSLSYSLPQTYAIEALRSVFARGWSAELPDVYRGILISTGWIFIMLGLSLMVVRVRKHTG
ncbi:ABC transporter G family member 20-like [Daphnia pulicaria]|uniref:ABC transporter G family member 20-like n=1 Tax=Daphnia pulicaria TaxID=35523 RepID=UPI001EEBB186|nr:ABC transporter G family member 20-like [Daphnia pulicaria]